MTRRLGAVVALGLVGLGSGATANGGSATSQRAAILDVMHRGKVALIAGNGPATCALFTANGRRRSLGFKVDFDEGGRIPSDSPRLPQTCEDIVRREWRDEHQPHVQQRWLPNLRRARFSVTWIRGTRAKVRLKVPRPYGPVVHVWLRSTPAGWRIDNSDVVPIGH